MEDLSFEKFYQYILKHSPKIMHLSWFNLIPTPRKATKAWEGMQKYVSTWSIKNPEWLFVKWDYQRSRDLIKYKYNNHLALFDSYPYHIQRSDMVRYFILHAFGGLYHDTDYVCVKPWNDVIKDYPGDLYLVETPNNFSEYNVHISNSLMFSRTIQHPFWRYVFTELEKHKDPPAYYGRHLQIMYTTGPGLLNKCYHATRLRYNLNFYPAELFHPKGLDTECFTIDRTQVYAYHSGSGSWESGDSKILIFLYQEHKILLFILAALILPNLIYWFINKKKK